MIFTISMMRQIEVLVIVLIICSVGGRGIDNLREAAETEPTMDDKTQPERRQEETGCGRRQIQTSKRDDGTVGTNDADQSDHLDTIRGGSDVTPGQFPWHVNVLCRGRRICGGAIVNEYWILTAASCVYMTPKRHLTVVVGEYQLSVNESWQDTYGVSRTVVHPFYSIGSWNDAIALIKVKPTHAHGILFNDYVQPICLPAVGESPAVNVSITVSGWGDNDTLQTGLLQVISKNECYNYLGAEVIMERAMCVRRTDGESISVCLKDIGGPATYQSGDTNILAGIIITDRLCLTYVNPGVLLDISVLRTWIDDRIIQFSNRRQGVIPTRAG